MQEHKLGVILFRGGASRQFAAARSTYRVSPRAHLMSRREGSVKGSLITLLIPTCKGVNTAASAGLRARYASGAGRGRTAVCDTRERVSFRSWEGQGLWNRSVDRTAVSRRSERPCAGLCAQVFCLCLHGWMWVKLHAFVPACKCAFVITCVRMREI